MTTVANCTAAHHINGRYCSIIFTNIENVVWLRNPVKYFLWDIMTHPYPKCNGGLTKMPLKLAHGWLITPHCFECMQSLISALIKILALLISVSKRGPGWQGILTEESFAVGNPYVRSYNDNSHMPVQYLPLRLMASIFQHAWLSPSLCTVGRCLCFRKLRQMHS